MCFLITCNLGSYRCITKYAFEAANKNAMDLLQNMCHISEGFNPLISTIDQDRISPNNINTKSREQEKRERKI